MSSNNIPSKRPRQDLRNKTSAGNTVSDPGCPVTIAMASELLFREERQQNTGPAFNFVKALKAVNAKLRELYPESEELFEVLLIGDIASVSLKKDVGEHGLEELVTVLKVSDKDLVRELQRTNTYLYLSAEPGMKVQEALGQGIAAAVMKSPEKIKVFAEDQLRVVFDGDAVIFSNESERVFQRGLEAFLKNEQEKVEIPMTEGPFKSFLEVLERLKMKLKAKGLDKPCPIRTYLVTSRGAGPEGYRALNSLRMWGLEMDEAVFLGGSKKGPTLDKISPHIFFDDQESHIKAALGVGTVACWVPINSD